jgi:hypothetical protein
MNFLRLLSAGLLRLISNVFALALRERGRAEAFRAQGYAFIETVRTGLVPAPLPAGPPRVRTALTPSRAGAIIPVQFRCGRPLLGLPASGDSSPATAARRRTYLRFLSLIGYVAPKDADFRLHLADHPGFTEDAACSWVFNRKLDAACASVVVPDPHFVGTRGYSRLRRTLSSARIPWDERQPRAMFRGSSTGGSLRAGQNSSDNPRVRLCLRSLESPGELDARITRVVNADAERAAELTALGVTARFMTPAEQTAFKYLVSIDGWAGEWDGLYWKLFSGSVVLLVESAWAQWYTDRLEPFVHYVPVSADLSNLIEQIRWCREHDAECRAIAERARSFLDQHVTFEQAVRYTAEKLQNSATDTRTLRAGGTEC